MSIAASTEERSGSPVNDTSPNERARCRFAGARGGSAPYMTSRHESPATRVAAAVAWQWFDPGPPPVTTTSQPRSGASARRNSSLRALFPASANPVRSSRLTQIGGAPSAASARSARTSGVGSAASRSRGSRVTSIDRARRRGLVPRGPAPRRPSPRPSRCPVDRETPRPRGAAPRGTRRRPARPPERQPAPAAVGEQLLQALLSVVLAERRRHRRARAPTTK